AYKDIAGIVHDTAFVAANPQHSGLDVVGRGTGCAGCFCHAAGCAVVYRAAPVANLCVSACRILWPPDPQAVVLRRAGPGPLSVCRCAGYRKLRPGGVVVAACLWGLASVAGSPFSVAYLSLHPGPASVEPAGDTAWTWRYWRCSA